MFIEIIDTFVSKFYLKAHSLSPDAKSARQVMSPKITLRNIPSKEETMNHVYFLSTPTKTNMNPIIEQIVHNQFQTVKPWKICLLFKRG